MNSSLFNSGAGGFAAEDSELGDKTAFGYSSTPLSSVDSILSAETGCHTAKPLMKWFSSVVENSLSTVLTTVLQEMLPSKKTHAQCSLPVVHNGKDR
jgi:hypothetical protein